MVDGFARPGGAAPALQDLDPTPDRPGRSPIFFPDLAGQARPHACAGALLQTPSLPMWFLEPESTGELLAVNARLRPPPTPLQDLGTKPACVCDYVNVPAKCDRSTVFPLVTAASRELKVTLVDNEGATLRLGRSGPAIGRCEGLSHGPVRVSLRPKPFARDISRRSVRTRDPASTWLSRFMTGPAGC